MNYYKRHLGDYAKDTGHLSALEHGVYTLLLDRYYSTERPIPASEAHKVARARSAGERSATDAVLSEFFKLVGGEWHHNYADRVIQEAAEKAKTNRENGQKGGRPITHEEPKHNPDETQSVISGLPEKTLAISHKPISKEKTNGGQRPPYPEDFEQTWGEYPKRAGDNPKGQAFRCWRARCAEGHVPAVMLTGVRRYAAFCRESGKTGTELVMQAKRFFGPDKPFLNDWKAPGAAPPKPAHTCGKCGRPADGWDGGHWCNEHMPVREGRVKDLAAHLKARAA